MSEAVADTKKNKVPAKPYQPPFEACGKCKSRWDDKWGRCQRCGGDKGKKGA